MPKYECSVSDNRGDLKRSITTIYNEAATSEWRAWISEICSIYNDNPWLHYIGKLDNEVVCNIVVVLPDVTRTGTDDDIIARERAFLFMFSTERAHRNRKCFSMLFKFIENDLSERGFTEITVGNAPSRQDIKRIFDHYGFDTFLKSTKYIAAPDENGSLPPAVLAEYYVKKLM